MDSLPTCLHFIRAFAAAAGICVFAFAYASAATTDLALALAIGAALTIITLSGWIWSASSTPSEPQASLSTDSRATSCGPRSETTTDPVLLVRRDAGWLSVALAAALLLVIL